jgi:hypothetical protein
MNRLLQLREKFQSHEI